MRGNEFTELAAFATVAEHRSFAKAASSLRVSPSTLSQNIRTLEQRWVYGC
jgi:DNA-binding transcriptional LysR family regulator